MVRNQNRLLPLTLKGEDRIAQMLILDSPQYKIEEADQLQTTRRETKGFGSTGQTAAVTKVTLNTQHQDNKDFKYDIYPKLIPRQYIELEDLLNEFCPHIMAMSFDELEGKH